MTHEKGVAPSRKAAGAVGAALASKPCSLAEAAELAWTGADWIWETDGDLKFSWLSDGYQAVTGIDPASVLGRFRFDFLKKAAKGDDHSVRHLEDLQARRPFRDFIYEPEGARAACRLVSTSGFPRFDEGGRFLGYRGTGRNVTAIAASLRAMGADEPSASTANAVAPGPSQPEGHAERMMAALNIMSDAFCYYDVEDRIVLYNEALKTIYRGLDDIVRPGVTFGELIEKGIERDLWDIEDITPAQWSQALLANRRDPAGSQVLLRFRDGRSVLHREMRTDDGGTVAICTDVTEMESGQAKLAKANKKRKRLLFDLERTIDAMNMGVVLLDAELNAEIINQTFFDLWRLQPGQVAVGSPFRALMDVNRFNGVYATSDAEWEDYVASRIAEIRSGDIAPREFARADGCTMIYSVTALSGGKRLVTYYDITEMKTRERELAETHERSRLAESVIDAITDPIFVKDCSIEIRAGQQGLRGSVRQGPVSHAGSFWQGFRHPRRGLPFRGIRGPRARHGRVLRGRGELRRRRDRPVAHRAQAPGQHGKRQPVCRRLPVRRDADEAARDGSPAGAPATGACAGVIARRRHHLRPRRPVRAGQPAVAGISAGDAGRLGARAHVARRAGARPMPQAISATAAIAEIDALYETDTQRWIDRYSERYHTEHVVSERQSPDGRWTQVYDSERRTARSSACAST